MHPGKFFGKRLPILFAFWLQVSLLAGASVAEDEITRWTTQTLYVPVYSHVYSGDREHPFYLAATLSLRNTDPKNIIRILSADYYDSDGRLLAAYLKEPQEIKALSSHYIMIKESDRSGGVGAKFIVRWESDTPCTQPIIEAVMIGAKMQQGVSFICRGQVLEGAIAP